MPDTQLDTDWDLRTPGQKAKLCKSVWGFIKTKKKGARFATREVADYVGASMHQARLALDELIAAGQLDYEGQTRSMRFYAK